MFTRDGARNNLNHLLLALATTTASATATSDAVGEGGHQISAGLLRVESNKLGQVRELRPAGKRARTRQGSRVGVRPAGGFR